MDVMELQFEHIDWNDIVDAELSGDQDALDVLRSKSMELKRSFSCPSPSPPPPSHSPAPPPSHPTPTHRSPRNTHFKVPRKHRKILNPKSLSYQQNGKLRNSPSHEFSLFGNLDEHYPSLAGSCSDGILQKLPFEDFLQSSYSQAVAPRSTKRTVSERACVSPVDVQPKRSALIQTPTEMRAESRLFGGEGGGVVISTPKEGCSEALPMEEDSCTPDNSDSKVRVAVQRRLFTPAKENTEPKCLNPQQGQLSDPHRLAQRQKQLDYGKNTIGYQRYIQTIPKWKRQKGDPVTPDKRRSCSTRSWQGQIKVWRRTLHKWDPQVADSGALFTAEEAALCQIDVDGGWGSVD